MRDGARAAAVPEQLAHVGEDQAEGVVIDGGLQEAQEGDGGAGGEGLLSDEAVGEDGEVLDGFAEVDDDAFGGREVVGREDGDVWVCGVAAGGEAEDAEAVAGEAGEDGFADAC